MRKLTKTLLMMLVLAMGTGLTSCELFMGGNDNPAPSPTPTPTPTPTPPTYKSDAERPLTFEALVDGVTVTFKFNDNAKPDYRKVEFSLDGGATWTALSSPAQPILLKKAGDIVMFRGDNPTYNGDARFVVEQAASQARSNTRGDDADIVNALTTLYGKLTSLLESLGYDSEKELNANNAGAFKEMFKNAKIETGKDGHVLILPTLGTIAVPDVFMSLFEGSTITQAPTVIANILAKGSLVKMFFNCPFLKNIILQLGYLAEGVTIEEAMGDMLGGTTGTKAKGGSVNLGWDAPMGGNAQLSNITLDDLINGSGISKEVVDNTTVSVTDETGKPSEPAPFEPVTGLKFYQESDISLEELDLTVGDIYSIYARVVPETASDKTIDYFSSDPRVAIYFDCFIKALSPGQATIAASHGNFFASIKVTVYPAVESVTLKPTELKLTVGDKETLTATVAPKEAKQDVTWSSSDATVAKVENGVVTAIKAGTAEITAKAGDKTATCDVTVTEPVTGPSIDDPGDYGKGGDPTQN
jgi:hypothetical protein